jgi:hypothetical protein
MKEVAHLTLLSLAFLYLILPSDWPHGKKWEGQVSSLGFYIWGRKLGLSQIWTSVGSLHGNTIFQTHSHIPHK